MISIQDIEVNIERSHSKLTGNVSIRKISRGFNLYRNEDNFPISRLKPTGTSDNVEVLYWSHRDVWSKIGDFGGIELPLLDAINYIDDDPMGIFW
jgi:hypothetical protein